MTIYVNDSQIDYFNFSGGECHVSIADMTLSEVTEIVAYLYSADDIMRLMMAVDAIKRKNSKTMIHLTIPYFPYGRQDRVCNEGEALSVAVMATMINSLTCERVTIYDPHSSVTSDLLNHCTVITQSDILADSIVMTDIKEKGLILVSPDAGAALKTCEVAKANHVNAIYCTKVRDTQTGKIISTKIPDKLMGENFIIIDDICDGGRTFIELAKALKQAGAEKIYLYVTHGIFSRGLDVLKESFEHVYCYHSFLDNDQIDERYLTIIEVSR